MPQIGKIEQFSRKAVALEKEYDWVKAAHCYKRGLGAIGKKDFLRKGEIQERIGYCFHRAAMQAESREEFRERMHRAIEVYKKAHEFYEKLADEQKARMVRCKAISKFLGYWLTSDPAEKKRLLDDCLELEGEALAAFLESGDVLEYGRTYNELFVAFFCRVSVEWDRQTLKSIVERRLEWGERAVVVLSELGNLHELARVYLSLAVCSFFQDSFIAEPEQQDEKRLEAVEYLSKAVDLLEKVGDTYVLGLSLLWLGANTGGEEAVRHLENGLECGKQTQDNWLIAWGVDMLAGFTYWKATATEDPEKRRELAEKAMQFYDKAQHHYSIMSYESPRGGIIGPPAGHAEHYLHLALWETDSSERLEFLEKAEKAGMEALKLAEDSDNREVVATVLHVVSKILETRSLVDPEPREKRSYLEKALKYREKTVEIGEQLSPFFYWNRGVMQNYLAGIKAELANIEPDLANKRRLLEEAVLSKEKCLKLCNKVMPYYEKMGNIMFFAALQGYQDTHATLLTRLFNLTSKPEHLRKAIEISQKAIESARKVGMVSLMAESYWKIANAQVLLKEHLEAAENFEKASERYMKAAEKISQLKEFYMDHALYMQAWSEIEKARHHHAERKYGQAKEHYEKAAEFHESTERWNYLNPNYLAWARLEEAEGLSRREHGEEATEGFKGAADLFCKAKASIETELKNIQDIDERKMATELVKASDLRHEYCQGRIALEEAKLLDRQGDHTVSSGKYGSAAERFQKVAQVMEHVADRRELRPIVDLSLAWQMMTRAEAEASPTLYLEASKLFDKAKEHSVDEKARMLSLGHSSFCKALEAGTRFEASRDLTLYSTTKKHIEAATNYYVKAGFKNASEYAKATYRLFDAYLYTYKAQTEIDPRKKAQFYQMAEKLLQASAGSYMKAKHPEKSEQAQRLLASVKEERQLAMSLSKVLHVPAIASTTTSFSTPTPTHEQAVGLERFEHADIQANLIIRLKEVKVDQDIDLEIELVNAGKAPAQLIKLQELIPEDFGVKKAPESYRVEDRSLNMKGKKLAPLKTEEIRLVLRPATKGTFTLKPRVMYLDETGKYKSHEPEPVTITVKELGIKGWIKGEK